MRIAVNTRLLLKDKLEGIGWFAHETLRRIVKNHPEHEFIFFFDRLWHPDFLFAPNVKPVLLKPQARHPFLYYLWTEWSIPYALRKYKADLYFSPDHLGSLHTKVPTVITLHDLAFAHYPEFMDKMHRWHYRHYLPRHARHARRIIAVSEFTKSDIIEQLKIDPDKIDVVHNGAHEHYRPLPYEECETIREKYTGGEEYFLFTGALHPRKNIINLLKAFVQFKRRQRSSIKLVIVGRMAWQFDEIVQAKKRMPFKEDVIWTGYMDVAELAKVTAAAYALVYPSLFEGFGIPILEAMACHVPVIISNTSSMPEVAGDAGLLVNPHSVADIAAKMMAIYKDERLREKLVAAAMVQKDKFSWDLAAEKLWESLMKAAKGSGEQPGHH
jgi:glycosyltransferase involved in cell wall biosynthesis